MYRGVQRASTVILDIGGVMIPSISVTRAMKRLFGEFGMTVSPNMIAKCARGSKREHIFKILDTHFPFSTSQTFEALVKLYPDVQLDTFIEDPDTLCKLLPGVLELQQLKDTALVVTTMFPHPIATYLHAKFREQNFQADAYFSATHFLERSEMIAEAKRRFPSSKLIFVGDTESDMVSGSKHRDLITVGLLGHSAEHPKNLSSRMYKAGATHVMYDLTDVDWENLV